MRRFRGQMNETSSSSLDEFAAAPSARQEERPIDAGDADSSAKTIGSRGPLAAVKVLMPVWGHRFVRQFRRVPQRRLERKIREVKTAKHHQSKSTKITSHPERSPADAGRSRGIPPGFLEAPHDVARSDAARQRHGIPRLRSASLHCARDDMAAPQPASESAVSIFHSLG